MTRDFFQLEGCPRDIDEDELYALVQERGAIVNDCLYRPEELKSKDKPRRWRVRDVTFINVSFSKTAIADFEFTNCKFLRCLFISTIFVNCRFSNCSFVDSNPFRIEFQSVYIDPRSFALCLEKKRHQNIGVYLYQELLRNSRQQSQPDFTDNAQYNFRRWQRYLLQEEIVGARPISLEIVPKAVKVGLFFVFDKTTGSGMRLSNLMATFLSLFAFLIITNWYMADSFGLRQDGIQIRSFIDSVYFSSITITTFGFGDITPTTPLGRLAVSLEAFVGFFLLAILSSTLYRRLSS